MKTIIVKNTNKTSIPDKNAVGFGRRKTVSRLLSLVLISILLAMVAVLLGGCGKSGIFIPKEYETDKYGYQRPKGMWISDVLVLPGMLSLENMFGESGESGIINTYAKENDGILNPEGTSYLVALCYGNPDSEYLSTYLRFTMVNDDGVY